MAQERFWNWKDDDLTFRLNWRDLGLHEAGRYRGFDWSPVAGMSFVFNHNATGVIKTKSDYSLTPKMGVWLTKQGVIITEDANVTVGTINPTASLPRIDLIVGRHQYVYSVGGAFATYSIIQGTPSSTPVAPSLPFPNEQIVLGTLYLPANATNLNDAGVVFTPAKVPYFAGTQLGLNDNYDVEFNNVQNGDILLRDAVNFKNVNGKSWIENLNIKMNNAFEEKALVCTSLGDIPLVPVAGAGGDGLNIAGVNKVIFTTGLNDRVNGKTIAGLPTSYQVGTRIRLVNIDKYHNVKFNSNINATNPNFLPIKAFYNFNDTDTIYMGSGSYVFERLPNYWLLIEENRRNADRVKEMSGVIVGYFEDIVGGNSVGTTYGSLAWIKDTLVIVTITCIYNTTNDSGFLVSWDTPIDYDFVSFMVYCTDSGNSAGDKTNDVLTPIVMDMTSTSFKIYLREVTNQVQNDIYLWMKMEKLVTW